MAIQWRGLGLILVAVEAAVAGCVVALTGAYDRDSRATGPESPVIAYAAALGREDLAGALDQLAPSLRPDATPFVEWQLGNRYTVVESAVRTGSILDRLLGRTPAPVRVEVTLVVQSEGYAPWRAVEELLVERTGGRWLLLTVPLKPPS